MTIRTDFDVKLIKATRPYSNATNGLITFQFHLARDIWTEILTHRASARNASSRRAMSGSRIVATHGAWMPEVFHAPATGMGHGEPLSPEDQLRAAIIWQRAIEEIEERVLELGSFVCKSEANRLLTGAHITAGVVTMTEAGWSHFLSLRHTKQADPAMYEQVAVKVKERIQEAQWVISHWHQPYWPMDYYDNLYHVKPNYSQECILIACARIARVSYGSTQGRKLEDDLRLAYQLLKDGHMSPFEHICQAALSPTLSALNCLPGDIQHGRGWETFRDQIQNGALILGEQC